MSNLKKTVFAITVVFILPILGSSCAKWLYSAENTRLAYFKTWPEHGTDALGWIYSLSFAGMAYTLSFGLYGLVLHIRWKYDYDSVVVDSYEEATYKMLPKEEYEKLSTYIPQEIKDAVLARDGMRCVYTGKKLYFEPPGKLSRWIWKTTKDSKNVGLRIISLMFERSMLDFGHIIPRRLGGKTKKENIVPEDRAHNRRTKHHLRGKKKKLALSKLKEWNETIHRKCL